MEVHDIPFGRKLEQALIPLAAGVLLMVLVGQRSKPNFVKAMLARTKMAFAPFKASHGSSWRIAFHPFSGDNSMKPSECSDLPDGESVKHELSL